MKKADDLEAPNDELRATVERNMTPAPAILKSEIRNLKSQIAGRECYHQELKADS